MSDKNNQFDLELRIFIWFTCVGINSYTREIVSVSVNKGVV